MGERKAKAKPPAPAVPGLEGLFEFENINNKSLRIAANRADRVLADGWQMKGGFPAIRIEGPIPWDDATPRLRSLVFYAHSWDMLDDLLLAHSAEGLDRFLLPALAVAIEWVERTPAPGTAGDSSMAWYDMAVGRRAYRLAYVLDVARRRGLAPAPVLEKLHVSLEQHRAYLADDAHIVFHTNHGFYQVAGQLAMARRFRANDPLMQQAYLQAQSRLERMLDIQFTAEGVHREHSPEYQLTVYSALQGILQAGLVEDPGVTVRCERIEAAMAWFVAPDQRLVGFGDTGERSVARKASEARRKWTDPAMQFTASGGETGRAPDATEQAFPQSGYFFARDRWPIGPEDFRDRAYLAFNAAFHSRTHKHADDLSFVWFDRGAPLLVDAGRYGYIGKAVEGSPEWEAGYWYTDPNRIYCESTRAHNTVEIDGRDLPRRDEPYGSAIGRSGRTGQGLAYCEAMIMPAQAVRFERLLVFKPRHWLLVIDRLASLDGLKHDFRPWFHLDPAIRATVSVAGIVAQVPGVVDDLHVVNLLPTAPLKMVLGQTAPVMQGFHSPAEQLMVPAVAIGTEALGVEDACFATLMSFGDCTTPDPGRTRFDSSGRAGTLGWHDAAGAHVLGVSWPAAGPLELEYRSA